MEEKEKDDKKMECQVPDDYLSHVHMQAANCQAARLPGSIEFSPKCNPSMPAMPGHASSPRSLAACTSHQLAREEVRENGEKDLSIVGRHV